MAWLSVGTKGRARVLRTLPPFAAEFTGPPQKPPRLGAQVCAGSVKAGMTLNQGSPRPKMAKISEAPGNTLVQCPPDIAEAQGGEAPCLRPHS